MRGSGARSTPAAAACLADELVVQGVVQQEGRIRLDEASVVGEIKSPAAGQICAVRCNGSELFAEPLYRD